MDNVQIKDRLLEKKISSTGDSGSDMISKYFSLPGFIHFAIFSLHIASGRAEESNNTEQPW